MTHRPPNPLMFAVRLRMSADSLEQLAADMGRLPCDPWLKHATELQGAVTVMREWASAIEDEQFA